MLIDFNKDPFTKKELEDIKTEYQRKDTIQIAIQFAVFLCCCVFAIYYGAKGQSGTDGVKAALIIVCSLVGIWLLGDLFVGLIIRKTPIIVLGRSYIPSNYQFEYSRCEPNDIWQCVKDRPDLISYVDKVISTNRSLTVLEVSTLKDAVNIDKNKEKEKKALKNWIRDYSAMRDSK